MSLAASHGTDRLLALVNAAVLRATPEALGMLLLRDDPQFARIVSGSAPALVAAALEDGRRLAASVRLAWGADPYAVARRRSIPVVQIAEDHCYGTTVLYAEYAERPPLIRLFGPSIGALNLHLADPRVRRALGVVEVTPVFVAHELYHHFDCMRDEPPLAARHRVVLLRFGPVCWTSGLVSLAEIAAGAFAQHLLGLRYHPKILDLLTLFNAAPRAAQRMVESLNCVCQDAAGQSCEGRAS